MDRLAERAAQWAIETQYHDALGQRRVVSPETQTRLVDALSKAGEPGRRVLPHAVVIRAGRAPTLHLESSAPSSLHWVVRGGDTGNTVAEGDASDGVINFPADLPVGTFRLAAQARNIEQQEEATLLVAPEQAYQGRADAPRRFWALAVQLYGVRSERNWGHGDFTDLAALIDVAATRGAAGIGLNPLHAMFDDRAEDASPYAPNSRLFLNPLYIDVESVPEFPGISAAGLEETVAGLRRTDIIDYFGVASAKMRGLEAAYENFRDAGRAERRRAFEDFRASRAPMLRRFACFEVLRRQFPAPWWDWPPEWQNANDDALARLHSTDTGRIEFVEYVQWNADEQLQACTDQIRRAGLPLGLYLDVAVGVCPAGFDAWSEREAVLHDVAVGAPPDELNTAGQNWGLAGLNPVGLQIREFKPFRRMLQASMRYAGAIRLDHVLGLRRLFLIPQGMSAAEGGYVAFPFEALLAVTAQESVWNKCIVIGEDLGTVPENFRETLADWGIWSYQVMLFEREHGGAFAAPDRYRENALVTFSTHDLPTFRGWSTHHDLGVKRDLGIDPGETDEQRSAAHRQLNAAVGNSDYTSVAEYLGRTPARLLVITMEDVLAIIDQPNVPGTINEHPNWRRRLPFNLEDLPDHAGLATLADIMTKAGRSSRREP